MGVKNISWLVTGMLNTLPIHQPGKNFEERTALSEVQYQSDVMPKGSADSTEKLKERKNILYRL